jgi:beta-lactamase superfamily II metal-dependent hydrolase
MSSQKYIEDLHKFKELFRIKILLLTQTEKDVLGNMLDVIEYFAVNEMWLEAEKQTAIAYDWLNTK